MASEEQSVGEVTLPDRVELAVKARRRLHRFGWFFAVSGLLARAAMVVFVAKLAGRRSGEDVHRLRVVGPLVIIMMAVTFALPVVVMRRRMRNPELLLGTDRGTQAAVRIALRDGHATDPRTDALARESARYQLHLLRGRRRFIPWVMGAGALMGATGFIITWVTDLNFGRFSGFG